MTRRIMPVRALTVLAAIAIAALCLQTMPAAAENTYTEQEGSHGVNTFTNYHNASGMGPRIGAGQYVQVSCKVYDPYIQSVNPDGYWYRIASSPWSDNYYSPANTFMNGDPWGGPYSHPTDWGVPDCGAASNPPPPPPPQPDPTVSLEQGPPASPGYWYVIAVDHFASNATVTVQCYDSMSPNGFRSFSLGTDGSGHGATQSQCRSGDGPDHWVVANGSVESNHVTWASTPSPSLNEPPSTPPPAAAPSTAAAERCQQPQGQQIPNSGSVAYALYDHYMWGKGAPVVIEWSYFKNSASFTTFAKALSIGQSKIYRDGFNTDMFYALGSFTVTRTSSTCFAIFDHYDFRQTAEFKKLPDTILTLPEWAYQLTGAREFDERAAGQL